MNQIPNYTQPIAEKGITSRAWYQFLQNLWTGVPPGNEEAIIVKSSPFTYTAQKKGFVIVSGGSVSMIQWARGTANYTTGLTAGVFPLSLGDKLVLNFTSAPTMTFAPQ